MASTNGHGNPKWTRDEVILALDLYFDCGGNAPSSSDSRVNELSELLRSFPYHSQAARKPSFRNADGVAFKLQNLKQIATGKGLGNVSRTDREVWEEFGKNPISVKAQAQLIRASLNILGTNPDEPANDVVFREGRAVTETHLRRERSPKIRTKLIEHRRNQNRLYCEICTKRAPPAAIDISESVFEAHHIVPLSVGSERSTKLSDMALLCACCHRIIHRAIAKLGTWISIDDCKQLINPKKSTKQ